MLFTLDDYVIKSGLAEHPADVQNLLVRCTDYFLLVNGSPPTPSSAVLFLESLPEGIPMEQKWDIGAYQPKGGLIGLIDAVTGYPVDGAWWLGLMLIDPDHRSQGLGRKLYQAFEKWINIQGGSGVYLGVIGENVRALRFWQSLGFIEQERRPPRQFGNKTHVVITLKRDIIYSELIQTSPDD